MEHPHVCRSCSLDVSIYYIYTYPKLVRWYNIQIGIYIYTHIFIQFRKASNILQPKIVEMLFFVLVMTRNLQISSPWSDLPDPWWTSPGETETRIRIYSSLWNWTFMADFLDFYVYHYIYIYIHACRFWSQQGWINRVPSRICHIIVYLN